MRTLFQKRHYDFIAKALSDSEACDAEVAFWVRIFVAENPKFNSARFEKAAFAYAKDGEE